MGVFLGAYSMGWAVNEAVQQTKHLYYHATGTKHERVPNDVDNDAFFDTFSHYERK